MKCCMCSYYKCSPDFNECTLLRWECYRESDNCIVVNDDGTLNEVEYERAKEYMW